MLPKTLPTGISFGYKEFKLHCSLNTSLIAGSALRKNFTRINLVADLFLAYVYFMIACAEFEQLTLSDKINLLYEQGTFVMAIRYYGYKVNLYLLGNYYLEVFVRHKFSHIEKIVPLDTMNTRMQFYSDQIKLRLD